jgi:capsular polysaccharide biosynthesis protein
VTGTQDLRVRRDPKAADGFSHESTETISFAGLTIRTPPFVAELEEVTITGEGVLFRGAHVLAESFARAENFSRWNRKRGRRRYEESVKRRPAAEIESAVWITDDWSKGYFHWLADVLPRIVVAADHLQDTTLLLPELFRGSALVHECLEIFGIANFAFVHESENVLAKRLYLSGRAAETGDFHPATIREVRRILTSGLPQGESSQRRIYISRSRAKRRKILNETEITDVLARLGFETVVAEELSFTHQIRLFASASCVVSIHGAGLANMLFMPEGGRILELRMSDPRSSECFANMASALGHDFHYLSCPAADAAKPPYTADLIVQPELLRLSLSDLFRMD